MGLQAGITGWLGGMIYFKTQSKALRVGEAVYIVRLFFFSHGIATCLSGLLQKHLLHQNPDTAYLRSS